MDYYNKVYKGQFTWKFSNFYSLSIGEGELIVSPLKMANVAAIIANRGWYIRPHLVKGIGTYGNIDPKYKEKISVGVAERHFNVVIDGMMDVVNHGTGTGAIVPGIQVCGKTGTSQNKKGKDSAIFICFAPKDDPKIAVAVFVENAGFGGSASAPIASLIIERYLTGKVEREAMKQKIIATSYEANVIPTGSPVRSRVDSLKIQMYKSLKDGIRNLDIFKGNYYPKG
ncbi:penicillin-binding transpeptidase domain-containing protein [Pseudarcicella hirudinis]|uniref:penicillin-binding transpeptidase domain-containing protein n=1 Tax=Pseudarcicella hirudinis TaxID=1079859 RepID=UPI0035F01945